MNDSVVSSPRSWQVLLLGGASGVGKTAVSYRLARHFGVGITEVDDFQVMLECLTTPEEQPVLHFWRTHPAPHQLGPEAIAEQGIAVAVVMERGLEAVIANHLETQTPVVLEGDFILPSLAVKETFAGIRNEGQVRAVFLYEDDEQQLLANFLRREPEQGPQTQRARVSWLYGQWIREEARRCDVPVLPSRPWNTTFERILEAID